MVLEEGKIIAEHYKLLKQLGHGSFGNVWLAYNMLADIDVAIKFYGAMDQKGLDEFRKEFKLTYHLRHPNLLNINHFDVFDNCPYLVMPYCSNGSVGSRIGKMSETEIWKFILDVSSGLDFLHSLEPAITHQDIKPDNILITGDGRYVITDFGISRSFRTKLSKASNLPFSSGTIAYMGPERFSKTPVIALASDIWAFGATLYEIITGSVLWEGMGGCAQLNGASLPDMDDINSPELRQLIKSCLSSETWERPSANEIYEYAKAYTQHKTLPKGKINSTSANESVKMPERTTNPMKGPTLPPYNSDIIQNQVSGLHSDYLSNYHPDYHSNQPSSHHYKSPDTTKPKEKSISRYALMISAIVICAVLVITAISLFVSYINEERAFVSCKTKHDYEMFVRNYPNSSHIEKARQRIAAMTSSPQHAVQPLRQQSVQPTGQRLENSKNEDNIRMVTRFSNNRNQEQQTKSQGSTGKTKRNQREKAIDDDDRLYRQCDSNDPETYRNYLRRYPKGKHAKEVQEKLDKQLLLIRYLNNQNYNNN